MTWWEVVDTDGWSPQQWEQRGKRVKLWVADLSGHLWLRKSPRISRPSEPAIEAFTLELARRCGFDVAHGRAAIWRSPDVGQQRGFVSRKFGEECQDHRRSRPVKIDRLFVLWADADGRRHVVGHLERTREVVRFWYDSRVAD